MHEEEKVIRIGGSKNAVATIKFKIK
jgi:hypothetical protein